MANVARLLFYYGFSSCNKYQEMVEKLKSFPQDGELSEKFTSIVNQLNFN